MYPEISSHLPIPSIILHLALQLRKLDSFDRTQIASKLVLLPINCLILIMLKKQLSSFWVICPNPALAPNSSSLFSYPTSLQLARQRAPLTWLLGRRGQPGLSLLLLLCPGCRCRGCRLGRGRGRGRLRLQVRPAAARLQEDGRARLVQLRQDAVDGVLRGGGRVLRHLRLSQRVVRPVHFVVLGKASKSTFVKSFIKQELLWNQREGKG